jgi:Fe-S-cluster containining protein
MTTKPPAPSELRFSCTGCGRCCTGPGDYYIEVSRAEQRRIQAYLGVGWRWFRRRYVYRYDETIESLRVEPRDGRCVFLDGDGRCRIYPVRPAQCRSYPFWPELIRSRAAWQAEARRCEGIGRGTPIPAARLRRLLKRAAAG